MDFHPVPKPLKKEKKPYKGLQTKKPLTAKTSLQAKSVLKPKPKLVEKIPKPQKKKKPRTKNELKDLRKGLKIPHKKVRSEFTDKERDRINAAFGGVHCAECGNPYIQHHHAKFRSGSGRGVFRNGVPLCEVHHSLAHKERSYADKWRTLLQSIYGEYYYMDKWDLWLMGKIENPKEQDYEEFMLDQEDEIRGGAF